MLGDMYKILEQLNILIIVLQEDSEATKFFLMFYLFLRERERDRASRGRAKREGDTESEDRLQALSCQRRARRGAQTLQPRDHDLKVGRSTD